MSNKVIDVHGTIQELYNNGDWRKVLKTLDEAGQRCCEVLWIRPDQSDLKFIKEAVISKDLNKVVSIGCGCGLLEWLIQIATDIPVAGIEIDPAYWNSVYFTRTKITYIPLIFPQDKQLDDLLHDTKTALLFCYFNNRPAFKNYINKYKGQCVIIIGPGLNSGRHADPLPFDADFQSNEWMLIASKEIRESNDFIAVYIRNRENSQ